MSQAARFQTFGVVGLVSGGALAVFSIFIPMIYQSGITNGAVGGATLTQAHLDKWQLVPGVFGLNYYWDHYMFNCSNIWDVVFQNQVPAFTQYGPMTYSENDQFANPSWPANANGDNLMNATYTQSTSFNKDDSGMIDTPMWLPNQAGYSAWWSMNNKQPWQEAIQILYHIVNMGLGERTRDAWVFQYISANNLTSPADIAANLIKINQPSALQQDRMFTDPYYGLNNPDNYWRWNQLRVVANTNTTMWNEKLAWQAEMGAAFGLNQAQIKEATSNWQKLYQFANTQMNGQIPSNSTYTNIFGTMYWQWANSYQSMATWGVPSMSNVMPYFYRGYYEISYFKSAYFNSNNTAQANVDAFQYIQLFNNDQMTGVNYENLFLTYDIFSNDPTSAPPSNSLFNMNNMMALTALGMSTPNILTSSAVYGVDFELNDDWYALTIQLGLDFSQQTYFLWLWLDTCMNLSWNRIQDGGNMQTGQISQLAANAFANSMTIMQLEFPVLVHAAALADYYSKNAASCVSFYQNSLNFDQPNATALCNDANSTFSWPSTPADGYMNTAVALLTVYFYGANFNLANGNYYDQFTNITGFSAFQITNKLQNPNAASTVLFTTQIAPQVYAWYSTVDGNICSNSMNHTACTFNNLTFAQWDKCDVLFDTPSWISPLPEILELSYTIYWRRWTLLTYPPEAYYWAGRSVSGIPHTIGIPQIYAGMQVNGLFTAKIAADLLVGYSDGPASWEFTYIGPGTPNYIKYVALNFGLGGMFTYRSPRTFIEGYTDPVLSNLASSPIFWGGDGTVNPWIQVDPNNSTSLNNSVSYYSGDGNGLLTRTFNAWYNSSQITVPSMMYNMQTQMVEPTMLNPWFMAMPPSNSTPPPMNWVAINGTDGKQFGGGLDTNTNTSVFFSRLSRNVGFNFNSQASSSVSNKLNVNNYTLDQSSLSAVNNAQYGMMYDGLSPLTWTLNAPAFASQGHFYNCNVTNTDTTAVSPFPVITDSNANPINATWWADSSSYGVEPLSGQVLQSSVTWQTSYQIVNDGLFMIDNTDATNGLFIPQVILTIHNDFTSSQINSLLGGIIKASKTKWVMFWIFLIVGILVLGAGVFMMVKSKQMAGMAANFEKIQPASTNDSNALLKQDNADE